MTDLHEFEAECRREIPLLDAMQLTFKDYHDARLAMQAPLAPNINNKGTAFGGSIASICLFAGWAVATLAFAEHGIHNTEIVVFKNAMTFERPARGNLDVVAWIEEEDFASCLAKLQAGHDGRLRLDIHVDLFHGEKRCATMQGLYVLWLKQVSQAAIS